MEHPNCVFHDVVCFARKLPPVQDRCHSGASVLILLLTHSVAWITWNSHYSVSWWRAWSKCTKHPSMVLQIIIYWSHRNWEAFWRRLSRGHYNTLSHLEFHFFCLFIVGTSVWSFVQRSNCEIHPNQSKCLWCHATIQVFCQDTTEPLLIGRYAW